MLRCNGNSEGGQGAEVSGGYWGLLGAELKLLTGVREKECRMQNAECKIELFFSKLPKLPKLLNNPY